MLFERILIKVFKITLFEIFGLFDFFDELMGLNDLHKSIYRILRLFILNSM